MIDYLTDNTTSKTLRAHAQQAEAADRPAPESLAALRGEGVFALRTPRESGGAWADVSSVARCLTALGRACPSTAWVAGTCATAKNLVAMSFPEASVRDFFADPDALACGSGLPAGRGERVADGVRVSGRWPNVSGCEDAAWAVLAVLVEGTFSLAVIPVADLTVERTWHTAGMRGTGSHTPVAADLLVTAERVAAVEPFPLKDLLLYAITTLGPVVGAARGALDAIGEMFASDRKPFMSDYSRMGESPAARQWLAEATHLVGRAERTMFAVAREAETNDLSAADRPRLHMDLADAGRDCRAAVELMLDLHGASGFDTSNALQRYWRDVAVGSRHPHLNPYLAVENFGAALVGHL
ncbi:acyl-CoA dehydrogenase family protein [Streptomyces sp. TRM 70361]|uniref:acyl-CoA dehydrogenase family protein n=1 Tax=Streptomyces sp. TRM 70361 TaxID=3116553 RepID=UPI002E7B6F09|nr:acyl-CoA dehydrogenase family protein [Streptomyces sp. TRM 70361]MEE1942828.1 acyl-CoA dehydrogenase family protein [Streptomyces sp. TRM 70361]